jgi:hypothetical protein
MIAVPPGIENHNPWTRWGLVHGVMYPASEASALCMNIHADERLSLTRICCPFVVEPVHMMLSMYFLPER